MAENTNAQAVAFVDEKLRIAADAFTSSVRTLRQLVADYNDDGITPKVAGTGELMAAFVRANGDRDPRTPVNGNDVAVAINSAAAILAWLDANPAYLAAINKPAVNSQPRF